MKEEGTPSHSRSFGGQVSNFATVKVVGNLGKMPGGKKIGIEEIETPMKVRDLLGYLANAYGLDLRRDSTLVLVNGVEANALDDLETTIVAGDHVDLVPMFHGGQGSSQA
jgi:molybdopterin converting factor small subunit